MIICPLNATPNQEFNIVLNEQNCTIQLRQLDKHIYFSLWLDSDLIIENAICLPAQWILQYAREKFSGNFLMLDTGSGDQPQSEANYSGLGDRYQLIYLSADEVAGTIAAGAVRL